MVVPGAEAPASGPSVADLLREGIDRLRAAGTERPRLDAELLLGQAAGMERTAIVAHPELTVDRAAAAGYEAAIARRERGEPVAYIRGVKEFFGLAFHVDARALIPRPETELLVELAAQQALRRLARRDGSAPAEPLRIVDVGTGSGAIPVALATALGARGLLGDVRIMATDISDGALALAARNLAAHGLVDAVALTAADLLPANADTFDLVLANLPYIASGDVPGLPVATSFEPVLALDGGPDGLQVIRRLLALLPARLSPAGVAILEIGGDQGAAIVAAVAAALPGWTCRVGPDLAGLPRVALVARDQAGLVAGPGRVAGQP